MFWEALWKRLASGDTSDLSSSNGVDCFIGLLAVVAPRKNHSTPAEMLSRMYRFSLMISDITVVRSGMKYVSKNMFLNLCRSLMEMQGILVGSSISIRAPGSQEMPSASAVSDFYAEFYGLSLFTKLAAAQFFFCMSSTGGRHS